MSAESQNAGNQATEQKRSKGAVILAVILAITTIIGLVWGGIMTSKYNSEKEANTSANSQISGNESEISADKAALAKLREELGVDDKKINSDTKNLAAEVEVAKQLRTQLDAAQKEDNTVENQLKVADAKTKLASQCAALLAAGYEVLYKDVATGVTYKEIAQQYKQASQACNGVVNFQPLSQ
ncbi:MAG: hypothetical protein WAS05_09630 [Candidatus Nanopelagicales bacterium]